MSNCTRCMNKSIYRNHMCKSCEEEHNEWLREEPEKREAKKLEDLRQQAQMEGAHMYFVSGLIEQRPEENPKIETFNAILGEYRRDRDHSSVENFPGLYEEFGRKVAEIMQKYSRDEIVKCSDIFKIQRMGQWSGGDEW